MTFGTTASDRSFSAMNAKIMADNSVHQWNGMLQQEHMRYILMKQMITAQVKETFKTSNLTQTLLINDLDFILVVGLMDRPRYLVP